MRDIFHLGVESLEDPVVWPELLLHIGRFQPAEDGGVKIGKGAKVRNCVIMQDTVIGANSRLDYVVADKNVEIEENRTLMGYQTYPVYIAKESKV